MKKCLCLLSCLCLLVSVLTGCNNQSNQDTTQASISILLKENIPSASIDQPYDLSALIEEENNVEYSYQVTYVDPESGKAKELKVKNGKITPKVEADLSVTITATQDGKNSSADLVVPIRISADIVDTLLASDSIAGQADANVSKQITKEAAYLQGENSTSSLSVTFSNDGKTSLLNLSHFALHAYYTAQVWRNAAVTFWVYNPMTEDVLFQLYGNNTESTQQTATGGQWTQIAISLYDMGITQPVIDSNEYSGEPSLQLLASYAGNETCTIYIDGVDIVHADTIETLTTGYTAPSIPSGNFSDLLKTGKVYTNDAIATLTQSNKGNGSSDAYRFSASEPAGYPIFYVDFPQTTDIRGFNYLKFDIYAENAYPTVTASIRYLDAQGQVQTKGCVFDFRQNEWCTRYLNLHALSDVDLSQVVGISFTVNMDNQFVNGQPNNLYFDNLHLYVYEQNEPQMAPATQEDHDLLRHPVNLINYNPATTGVCKVATDETGLQKSNSTLLFWTNNTAGYPVAQFIFEAEEDWSDYSVLSFETHQVNAHYWMRFDILYLDEDGKQQTLTWHHDTIFNHWLSNNAPLKWFATKDGTAATPEHLKRVVGFQICVNLKSHVDNEVAYIFYDNFELN